MKNTFFVTSCIAVIAITLCNCSSYNPQGNKIKYLTKEKLPIIFQRLDFKDTTEFNIIEEENNRPIMYFITKYGEPTDDFTQRYNNVKQYNDLWFLKYFLDSTDIGLKYRVLFWTKPDEKRIVLFREINSTFLSFACVLSDNDRVY